MLLHSHNLEEFIGVATVEEKYSIMGGVALGEEHAKGKHARGTILKASFAAVIYTIWTESNTRIFLQNSKPLDTLINHSHRWGFRSFRELSG